MRSKNSDRHASKGKNFRGQWHSPCSSDQATQIVAEDDMEQASRSESESQSQAITGRSSFFQRDDYGGDEGEDDLDELGPLPTGPWTTHKQSRQQQSHVVLLLDASGSMRICDAGVFRRFEIARTCGIDFIARHAECHPKDLFSIATFSEQANLICELCPAGEAMKSLEAVVVKVGGGTRYVPALYQASSCLGARPGIAGHVVLLSDGRPADTKDALEVFQELFLHGNHVGARLHGIAFGSIMESFAALQQLACIGDGSFTLSGCSARELCVAFTSVSSSITSVKSSVAQELLMQPTPKRVHYEQPKLGISVKKGVLRCHASCVSFQYDGQVFEKQERPAGPVQRRRRPNMRGGMRLVYGFNDGRMTDQCSQGWMVAKLSRFSDPSLNDLQVVETHAKSTAVARYFAALFEEKARLVAATVPTLEFLPCFVYTVENPTALPEGEPEAFTAERYLPGAFVKYNSNSGYVSQEALLHHDAVQAFLHFSFVSSGGRLAVTDLQGVARDSELFLTDPQVVTAAGGGFGPGDLGVRGLRACLTAHRCGPTCRRLGLQPVSGSVLRKLEAMAPRQCKPCAGAASSALSTGTWQRVGSTVSASVAEWECIGEVNLEDFPVGEGVRSSQASGASWVLVA